MLQKLKPKEQKVLDYVKKFKIENGYAPSVRDVCRDLDYKSTSTVHMYLNRLELLGYIVKEDGKSRAINLVDEAPKVKAVPVIGTVAAGTPILAEQSYEGYIGYIPETNPAEELFALRVKGDSMVDIGICNGDMVIAEKTCYAENGEIVVALVDNEATVKTFYREDGHYRLQPENATMQPIIVDEVVVLGRVLAIQRRYC
jgi:repressor LexA